MSDDFRVEEIGGDGPLPRPEPIKKLEDLQPFEAWELWKQRSGLSNKAAALDLGIKPDIMRSWAFASKTGVIPIDEVRQRLEAQGPLTDGERCFCYRKRMRLKMSELSGRMGCSRIWIWHMETGKASPKRLLDLYENWVA